MTEPIDERVTAASKRTITNERLDRLSQYVLDCQIALGLSEWETRLKLDRRPSSSDAMAEIIPVPGRLLAAVVFDEAFFEETPEEQRHYVCHELTHLLARRIDEALYETKLEEATGRAAFVVFSAGVSLAVEHTVDRVAELLAPTLPLPNLDEPE